MEGLDMRLHMARVIVCYFLYEAAISPVLLEEHIRMQAVSSMPSQWVACGQGGNIPAAVEQASSRGGPSQGAASQAPSSAPVPSQQGSVDGAPDGPQQNGR